MLRENDLRIRGQETAVNLLLKIYKSNKIPHSFLFTGLNGTGKFSAVIQFIKLLNSSLENFEKIAPKIDALEEPYIKFITPLPRGSGEGNDDNPLAKIDKEVLERVLEENQTKAKDHYHKYMIEGANTIKISSIRNIRKFISLEYSDIPFRAIIILDAHIMNEQSQNALLKSLEEPPEGIIFFLLTSKPDLLLKTIKSRCWQIKFNPLTPDSIFEILVNNYEVDPSTADAVSILADGSVTNAVSLIENDFKSLLEKAISILRYSLAKRYNLAYKEFVPILEKSNKVLFDLILSLICHWLTDVLKYRSQNDNFYFRDHLETIIKYNKKYPNTQIAELFIRINNLKNSILKNVSLNIITLNVIFEIRHFGTR